MTDSPSPSPRALLRYQVVSQLKARVLGGTPVSTAIEEILELAHFDHRGRRVKLSERSIYRWLNAYEADGLHGLEPEARRRIDGSAVLSAEFLAFLETEKKLDARASVPDLIERARLIGVLDAEEGVSRTTVWRACRRLGLALRRPQKLEHRDMRRFAYPHRMMMVLADGKHFRAGRSRKKRVALHLLDDATRFGLGVVVSTSEHTELFLEALHKAILSFGLMQVLFLDNGPGFISGDTHATVARLGVSLINGTACYPEGHGKIERFHRTLIDRCLRSFDGNPEVDPDPAALTLRLTHWLREVYNHKPHEALDGATPAERFTNDSRKLDMVQDRTWLDSRFEVGFERRVAADNVVSWRGRAYELPIGHAGEKILLTHHLLDASLSMRHQGRRVKLHPVDLEANAYSRRARGEKHETPRAKPAATTAAGLRYDADFGPLVGPDGSFPKPKGDRDDEENS